jgi:hypothetical protein
MKRWALVISVLFGVLLAPYAGATVGVGGRPASPDPKNPRTESIFIHTIKPSETQSDTLLVANNTNDKQTIQLYAVDGTTTNTGSFTCRQRSETPTDIGSWIKLDTSSVTLEANTQTKVNFTITASDHADAGEHTGCIVIQKAPPEGSGQQGMLLEVRSAVRIVATVPGDLKKDVDISALQLTETAGAQKYDVDLVNKGNVSVDTKVAIRLAGAFNENVFEDGGEHPILREGRLQLNYQNTHLPFWGGWYTLRAEIKYDERPYVFGTAQSDTLTTKSRSLPVFIWPNPSIFIVLGLLIIVLIAWLWRRRLLRRSRE